MLLLQSYLFQASASTKGLEIMVGSDIETSLQTICSRWSGHIRANFGSDFLCRVEEGLRSPSERSRWLDEESTAFISVEV